MENFQPNLLPLVDKYNELIAAEQRLEEKIKIETDYLIFIPKMLCLRDFKMKTAGIINHYMGLHQVATNAE